MDIFVWFLQKNASALAVAAQSQSSILLAAYLVLSIFIKRPSILMAFFISCILFECSLFDGLSESSLYLLTFAVYSYVITCKAMTFKQRIACGIIIALTITLAYDAYFYGVNGLYGEHETFIYSNIEYLSLCAHIFFISTLINFTRVKNSLRDMLTNALHMSRNSAYIVIC